MKPPTNKDAKGPITAAPPTDAKAGDGLPTLYDDFEPLCGWRREEGQQTLVVHVPEFKRDQMKVHISKHDTLRITGERPIGGTKWSRFTKEIKFPNDCNPNEITAKLANDGALHIRFPKIIVSLREVEIKQDLPTQVVQQAPDQNQPPKSEGTDGHQVAEESRMGFLLAGQTITRSRKVVMGAALAAVVAIVVALGALATYNYTRPARNV